MGSHPSEDPDGQPKIRRLSHDCVRWGVADLEEELVNAAVIIVIRTYVLCNIMVIVHKYSNAVIVVFMTINVVLTMIASLHLTPSWEQMYSALCGSGFDFDTWLKGGNP